MVSACVGENQEGLLKQCLGAERMHYRHRACTRHGTKMGLTIICHRANEELCDRALVVLGEDHGGSVDLLSALADDCPNGIIASCRLHNLHLVRNLQDTGGGQEVSLPRGMCSPDSITFV